MVTRFTDTILNMINIKKEIIILCVIFIIALFVRFYDLAGNPPSLTWDEVSWGYNAYTLGQVGRDEFGVFLPVTFLESFGDFKPPVYAYLSILPIKILGINEFSTRFVSALFGSISILIVYLLTIQIFYQSKKKKLLGLTAAALLAISPWHILLSRAAFEANVASFFIMFGVFLYLYSTRSGIKFWFLLISCLSFVTALYTFNTSRVFLPIFVPLLFAFRYKTLLSNYKAVVVAVLPAILLCIPLFMFLITPQAKLRYEEVNIFSDIKVIERTNQEILNDNNSSFSKIIHNRRLAYGVEYVKHYLDNFDPGFLFITGDGNPKFSIQDVGQLYIWELPFLILGIGMLVRKREGCWYILPLWILIGIIPAATARETPHALRIETTLPAFQILTAYGLLLSYRYIFERLKNKKVLFLLLGVFGIICISVFTYFMHTYFVHYPKTYAGEWQYGYKEAINFSESQKSKYKKIYITEDLGRPYIYVLFYGKYDPNTLKSAEITREALGFVHVNRFGKYNFAKELPYGEDKVLYISSPHKVPNGAHRLKNFKLPNGATVLVAYEK